MHIIKFRQKKSVYLNSSKRIIKHETLREIIVYRIVRVRLGNKVHFNLYLFLFNSKFKQNELMLSVINLGHVAILRSTRLKLSRLMCTKFVH